METQKEAISLVQAKKFQDAINKYPKYPDAYINLSLQKEVMQSFEEQRDIIQKGLDICPGNTKLEIRLAQLHFQWDENNAKKQGFYSNNIRTAERMFHELLEKKGGSEDIWYLLSLINAKYKKDYDTAVKYMRKVYEINPSRWADCQKYIAAFWRDKGLAE
jgi:tetratricopeptide (TPR) repeat protein